jgi:uracil-DNA glycosylase
MIVGESWGSEERHAGRPFVGTSGKEFTRILAEAGIDRESCFITNVVPEQPHGNEMAHFFYSNDELKRNCVNAVWGLYPKPNVSAGLDALARQIAAVRPDIIIACGNYALWALTTHAKITSKIPSPGMATRKLPSGIAKWRGSQLYTREEYGHIRVVPIYHPAAIIRQWNWRYITVHDLKQRVVKPWAEPEYDFIIRPGFPATKLFLEKLLDRLDTALDCNNVMWIAEDLETRGGYVACVGIALSDRAAICIPLLCVEDESGYWPLHQEYELRQLLDRIHRHPALRIYGQNFLYDMQYLAAEFMPVNPASVFDTMIAQHLCWPGTLKGLDYISSLYCRHHVYWKDEGKLWDTSIPEDEYWQYNCKDACATYECGETLHELITTLGFDEQWDLMQRQIGMVFRMMQRGIRIDKAHRSELSLSLLDTSMELEQWLTSAMLPSLIPQGKTKRTAPWYRSQRKQVGIFYDELGMTPIKDRRTGSLTLNADALTLLAKREPALGTLFTRLSELRSVANFHNVVNTHLDFDDRMRCSFNIAGTETFRWSSSENAFGSGTNLQNLSKGHEEDE